LDSFRWDYYERQKSELRGLPLFLQEGVQTEWVEPVFPSHSYPAWTTISTGVYPENHGIIGNYMFDLKHSQLFNLLNHTSTSKVQWWQNAEPIWITATRYNKKAFLRFWSRCDVPFNDIKPETCSGYREAAGLEALRSTLFIAVNQLQKDYDLVMVNI
jgi:ectonucleotide pyrophosphatase/phosphodiesterase family protein 6